MSTRTVILTETSRPFGSPTQTEGPASHPMRDKIFSFIEGVKAKHTELDQNRDLLAWQKNTFPEEESSPFEGKLTEERREDLKVCLAQLWLILEPFSNLYDLGLFVEECTGKGDDFSLFLEDFRDGLEECNPYVGAFQKLLQQQEDDLAELGEIEEKVQNQYSNWYVKVEGQIKQIYARQDEQVEQSEKVALHALQAACETVEAHAASAKEASEFDKSLGEVRKIADKLRKVSSTGF